MSLDLFEIVSHQILGQHVREYPGATRHGRDTALKLAVKKYIPHKQPKVENGVTIIAAGGNGFPKEMYEPLWDDLVTSSERRGFSIQAIWIADMIHQGKSGEMNEDHLGSDPSWLDCSRDLLALVNNFRDEMTSPLIGIGHSIGANALVNLSIFHPRLLSGLILFEPILDYVASDGTRNDCTAEGLHFAHLASKQRRSWPSQEAAERAIAMTRPYVDFDPRVRECWFKHGLRPADNGVELVTSKPQEAVTYVRPLFDPLGQERSDESRRSIYPDLDQAISDSRRFYCPESWRTFTRLPELRPQTLFVIGGRSVMFSEQKRKSVMSVTGTSSFGNGGKANGAVEEVILPVQGHLLTFENPSECAEVTVGYLASFIQRYRKPPVVSSIDPVTDELTPRWRHEIEAEVARARAERTRAKI